MSAKGNVMEKAKNTKGKAAIAFAAVWVAGNMWFQDRSFEPCPFG